eukprot:3635-Chlamydomonas_euryale.AAC.8
MRLVGSSPSSFASSLACLAPTKGVCVLKVDAPGKASVTVTLIVFLGGRCQGAGTVNDQAPVLMAVLPSSQRPSLFLLTIRRQFRWPFALPLNDLVYSSQQ